MTLTAETSTMAAEDSFTGTALILGELKGRVASVETRQAQHEASLSSMRSQMESNSTAIQTKIDGLTASMQVLQASFARQDGKSQGIGSSAQWAITMLSLLATWVMVALTIFKGVH